MQTVTNIIKMTKLLEDTDFRGDKEISDREIYNGEIFNTLRAFRNPIYLSSLIKEGEGRHIYLWC